MTARRAGQGALAVAALSLSAAPASAHGDLPGGGGFLSGALHPFAALEHLVLLLALGLLAGRLPRARRGPGLAALAAGLLAGLAGVVAGGAGVLPAGAALAAILALALGAGIALALDRVLPGPALAALCLPAGLLVGLDTDVPGAGAALLAPALGTVVAVFLIVLDAAALSAWAVHPPLPIARRVAGSWIAAIALMLLALALAPPGSAA